jgi:hypothetical protein
MILIPSIVGMTKVIHGTTDQPFSVNNISLTFLPANSINSNNIQGTSCFRDKFLSADRL